MESLVVLSVCRLSIVVCSPCIVNVAKSSVEGVNDVTVK